MLRLLVPGSELWELRNNASSRAPGLESLGWNKSTRCGDLLGQGLLSLNKTCLLTYRKQP